MPLYFITGASGTGKSTLCEALNKRGYVAYDGDRDHIARWYNKTTGQMIPKQNEQRTSEWLEDHAHLMRRSVVGYLADTAGNEPVFLCGNSENEFELLDLFVNTFALVVDDKTWHQRLDTRTNNTWGKSSHERDYSTRYREGLDKIIEKAPGWNVLDATQPTEVIVDTILNHLGHESRMSENKGEQNNSN